MKFFGRKSEPSTEPSILQARWFKMLLTLCGVLLVIAACTEAYVRVEQYGKKVVEKHPIPARIKLANPPAWLAESIILDLQNEAYAYVQRDAATTERACDILDKDILTELAANYTGTVTTDDKPVNRWTVGNNAWIKRITEVRRVLNPAKTEQTIEILADWRKPAAWVRHDDKLYLIDTDAVRLPGEYPATDREVSNGLMVVTGVDLPPAASGKAGALIPQPSDAWTTDDLAAGMQLAYLLAKQSFAGQIAAIDMTNYRGRQDPLKPWILLDTVFPAADGAPRVVQWGRPIGEEKFYEISSAAKLKALNNIYLRFNRIDADHDYVDIRTEQVRLPKLAAESDPPIPNTHS